MRSGVRALVVAAMVAGCDPQGATVLVILKTDLVAGTELTSVRVRVGELPSRNRAITFGEPVLEGLRVAELDGLRIGEHARVEAQLFGGDDLLLERIVVARLRTATTAVVILATRSCRGVPCAGDTSCVGGRCVAPECTLEDRAACPPPACSFDAECPAAPVACARARCEAGVCLLAGDDSRCASGEYCDPDDGCAPIPGRAVDAGVPDGGALPPNCTGATGCPSDADCDGLPDARDPAPSTCNRRLYALELDGDVLPPDLSFASPSLWRMGGGVLRIDDVTTGGRGTVVSPGLDTRDYLVEVRVTIDESGATPWRAGTYMRRYPGTAEDGFINCEIWNNPTYVSGTAGHIVVADGNGSSAGRWTRGGAVSPRPGAWFYVQARAQGTNAARCLIYDEGSRELVNITRSPVPPVAGTVELSALHVRAAFDYLRVYAL